MKVKKKLLHPFNEKHLGKYLIYFFYKFIAYLGFMKYDNLILRNLKLLDSVMCNVLTDFVNFQHRNSQDGRERRSGALLHPAQTQTRATVLRTRLNLLERWVLLTKYCLALLLKLPYH